MTPDPQTERIQRNPKYQALRHRRNRFGWTLTILMLIVYYGYVGLIAFDKAFLGQPMGTGVTTIGIPMALGVIVFSVLVTGLYVRRANNEYDRLTAEILAESAR